MDASQSRLLSLPDEILFCVRDHLAGETPAVKDLSRLSRTCKRLSASLRPALFSNVTLRSPRQAEYVTQAAQSDPSLGEHVRALEFAYVDGDCADATATALLPLTPNLVSLSISSASPEDDERLDSVGDMTEQSFQFLSLFADKEPDDKLVLKPFLPHLQTCSFEYTSSPWSAEEKLPFLLKPGLTSLTMSGVTHNNENALLYEGYRTANPEAPPKSDLTHLKVVGQVEAGGLKDLLSFPRALKSLDFRYRHYDKVFKSDEPNATDNLHYWCAVDRINEHLESLVITGATAFSQDPQRPTFAHFPELKTLRSTASFLGDRHKADERHWIDILPKHIAHFSLLATRADANKVSCYPRRYYLPASGEERAETASVETA